MMIEEDSKWRTFYSSHTLVVLDFCVGCLVFIGAQSSRKVDVGTSGVMNVSVRVSQLSVDHGSPP